MAAYVYDTYQDFSNGSTVWKLSRVSKTSNGSWMPDGFNWTSPTAGSPLGSDSSYLRVVAASCFGCDGLPADANWNCGGYVTAPPSPLTRGGGGGGTDTSPPPTNSNQMGKTNAFKLRY